MIETLRIPRIHQLAMQHAEAAFKAHLDEIGRQAVLSMGRDPDNEDWKVDFTTGFLSREVPDPPPAPPAPIVPPTRRKRRRRKA